MNFYPNVSLILSKQLNGNCLLTTALKGKEDIKILELLMKGHSDIEVYLTDCKLVKVIK